MHQAELVRALAENFRPVTNSSRAAETPIFRITNGEITAGTMPSLTSLKPKTASSAATTASQTDTRPTPPAIAAPWTRPTTACGSRSMASSMSCSARASARMPLLIELRPASHPVEVGPGGKDLARARQHDDVHRVRRGGRRVCPGPQLRDDAVVEGVAHGGPIEPDALDRPVPLHLQEFERHAPLADWNLGATSLANSSIDLVARSTGKPGGYAQKMNSSNGSSVCSSRIARSQSSGVPTM